MERVIHDIRSLQLEPSHREYVHTYTFVHLSLYSYGRCRTYAFEGLNCQLESDRIEILKDDHPVRMAFVNKNPLIKKWSK